MSKHTEIRFEEAIEHSLLEVDGYVWGDPKTFDAGLGLFPQDVLDFIKDAQAKRWQQLFDLHGEKAGGCAVVLAGQGAGLKACAACLAPWL